MKANHYAVLQDHWFDHRLGKNVKSKCFAVMQDYGFVQGLEEDVLCIGALYCTRR